MTIICFCFCFKFYLLMLEKAGKRESERSIRFVVPPPALAYRDSALTSRAAWPGMAAVCGVPATC